MTKSKISVIVSCFNEEAAIPLFYEAIKKVANQMADYDFEYLFIDDGSKDHTLSILKDLAKEDKDVRFIAFSRNFGKEAAMYAGLKNATGDYVTLMDADLQDPPALLPKMMTIINEGYDQVGTRRKNRTGEPPIRSFFARKFYKLINRMVDRITIVDGARDYRLMTRKVVNAILALPEYSRFSKGLFSFVGFKTKWLEYENIPRVAGTTKWSFTKLFKYAIDGIVAFTVSPLLFTAYFGLALNILSIILFIIILIKGFNVSLTLSLSTLIIFLSSFIFIFMGIMGEYLAKVNLEVKRRPLYIVSETEKDMR
jgi:glucosyltransferase